MFLRKVGPCSIKPIHIVDIPFIYKIMMTKSSTKIFRDVHELVDYRLYLLFPAHLVELLAYDLDDIKCGSFHSELEYLGHPMAPSNGPPGGATCAPDASNPVQKDMVEAKNSDKTLHPLFNIGRRKIFYHLDVGLREYLNIIGEFGKNLNP